MNKISELQNYWYQHGFDKVAVGYFGGLAGKRSLVDKLFMKKQNLLQRILNRPRKISIGKTIGIGVPSIIGVGRVANKVGNSMVENEVKNRSNLINAFYNTKNYIDDIYNNRRVFLGNKNFHYIEKIKPVEPSIVNSRSTEEYKKELEDYFNKLIDFNTEKELSSKNLFRNLANLNQTHENFRKNFGPEFSMFNNGLEKFRSKLPFGGFGLVNKKKKKMEEYKNSFENTVNSIG